MPLTIATFNVHDPRRDQARRVADFIAAWTKVMNADRIDLG